MTRGNPFVRAFAICALLIVAALAVAACGSSSSSGNSSNAQNGNSSNVASSGNGTTIFGNLPPDSTVVKGGTISQGQLSGQTPTYIFPIINSENVTSGTISLVSNLYMPLYAGPKGARPETEYNLSAAAGPPVSSNGDKTYTIHLKPGLKWSNGQPITSKDVLFFIDVLKAGLKASPANWGQYVPGEFPTSVTSATTPNATTLVLNLDRPYNPGFFLNNQLQVTNNVFPMPSQAWNIAAAGGPHISDWATNPADALKIYTYLAKQGGSVATFGSNPLWKVVSGPFSLKSFSATNSSYVLAKNPSYGGSPKPYADQIDVNTYTGFDAELNAMKSGGLDIMTGFDPSEISQMGTLKSQGIDVFGGPGWGWFGGIYNFEDGTDHFGKVITQLYARQALAYLTDQPGIIKGIYKGAAVPAYGPIPSAPSSPYTPPNATNPAYPYNPAKAVSLLKANGWKVVPNGQSTCVKPGSGSGECGAGIPAGTPFKFVWANRPAAESTTGALESEALGSIAKQQAGINIEFQTKTFNFLVTKYTNTSADGLKQKDDWGVNNFGGLNSNYYPTADGSWNHPHTGLNIGSANDPQGAKLIQQSVYGTNPKAVTSEASYWGTHPPVAFFPGRDYLLAVNSKKVGSVADGWTAMTQQQWWPQYWHLVKGAS
jgi:peptide/nickel transport system substrate-binding protein